MEDIENLTDGFPGRLLELGTAVLWLQESNENPTSILPVTSGSILEVSSASSSFVINFRENDVNILFKLLQKSVPFLYRIEFIRYITFMIRISYAFNDNGLKLQGSACVMGPTFRAGSILFWGY